MTSNIKFGRKIKVSFNSEKFIEDLRMRFRIERIIGDSFAKMKLEIYNMVMKKEGDQDVLFTEGDKISIEAGYNENVSVLFTGIIKNIEVIKLGIDTVTTIFSSDLNSDLEPIINVSYRNQNSLISLISDIAFEADIEIAEISIKPQNIKGKISYSKKFSSIMDDLARTYDFSWYIFNFDLYLYDNDSANSTKQVLQINAGTGLLETPIVTQKGIDVKMLLEPSIRPKDKYEVKSGGLQFVQSGLEIVEKIEQGLGVQTVLSLVHTGDTHSSTWFTEIEGLKEA